MAESKPTMKLETFEDVMEAVREANTDIGSVKRDRNETDNQISALQKQEEALQRGYEERNKDAFDRINKRTEAVIDFFVHNRRKYFGKKKSVDLGVAVIRQLSRSVLLVRNDQRASQQLEAAGKGRFVKTVKTVIKNSLKTAAKKDPSILQGITGVNLRDNMYVNLDFGKQPKRKGAKEDTLLHYTRVLAIRKNRKTTKS